MIVFPDKMEKTLVIVGLANRKSFKLKGTLTPVVVMNILNANLIDIDNQLGAQVNAAPKMFEGANMVIDFCNFEDNNIDFGAIKNILEKYKIILVGIKNCEATLSLAAKNLGINVLADSKPQLVSDTTKNQTKTLIKNCTIRSGQQIFAEKSDLIIVGNVSPAAEVIADGNIHVYGVLSGRAIAGASGDTKASIFAAKFNAELVSIGSIFKTFENPNFSKTVRISVEEDVIVCEEL